MFIKSIKNRLKKEGIAFDTSRITIDVSDTVHVVIDSEEYYEYNYQSCSCKTTKMWSRKHNWRGLRVKYFTDFVVKCIREMYTFHPTVVNENQDVMNEFIDTLCDVIGVTDEEIEAAKDVDVDEFILELERDYGPLDGYEVSNEEMKDFISRFKPNIKDIN